MEILLVLQQKSGMHGKWCIPKTNLTLNKDIFISITSGMPVISDRTV